MGPIHLERNFQFTNGLFPRQYRTQNAALVYNASAGSPTQPLPKSTIVYEVPVCPSFVFPAVPQ